MDWENSGQKQIGYDLFILLIKSRVTNNFSNRFLKLVNNELDRDQVNLINSWPEINWEDKELYLTLFLLEELDFHIDEKNNSLFFNETEVLIARCKELEKAIQYFYSD